MTRTSARTRTFCVRIHRPSGERGSFTFAVIFWALIAMMLAGLVVDGGLAITERQRAGDIAEQAARAGAEVLNPDDLRQGTLVIEADAACNRAQAVGAASGLPAGAVVCDVPGTAVTSTGQTVPALTVHVKITYSPILLGMFYSKDLTAKASATAYPQPGT
jgi:Flp pilus assembly protein TadG